jgi:hypothetical protein
MAYAIAGRAGDTVLARCELIGRRIQQLNPQITISFDAKHPTEWEKYVKSVERMLDLPPLDVTGPLIWTPEGYMMSSTQFSEMARIKFGYQAPSHTDPMFAKIAEEHMADVEEARTRAKEGDPLGEQLLKSAASNTNRPYTDLQRTFPTVNGVLFEVWTSREIFNLHNEHRKAYNGRDPMGYEVSNQVSDVGESHNLVLAHRPIVPKHSVLLPVKNFTIQDGMSDGPQLMMIDPFTSKPNPSEFVAVAETLDHVSGICTLQRLPDGSKLEFRTPLDSHIQFLPFPLVEQGTAPLLPWLERQKKTMPKKVPFFEFTHSLCWFKDLTADALESAFKSASSDIGLASGMGYDLVIGEKFLLLAPIKAPAPALREQWDILPPVPSVALMGLVILPTVKPVYPETTGDPAAKTGAKITADRVLSDVYDAPLEVLGHWR